MNEETRKNLEVYIWVVAAFIAVLVLMPVIVWAATFARAVILAAMRVLAGMA